MTKKLLFVFLILFAGSAGLFAAELSGTYDKDYTVRTDFNTIAAGKTLHVTNGATYVMRDAIVHGSIVVDKGCKFISPDDYEGYLVFHKGTHVEGIDLYYKVRVSEDLVFTRKIPMTDDVHACFKRILEIRPTPMIEPNIQGKCGFLYLDKNGMPMVALHWEK